MASYTVMIGERKYQIEKNQGKIMINGEPFDINLVPLNKVGLYLLKGASKVRELYIRSKGQATYTVMANGRHIEAQVEKNNGQKRKQDETKAAGDLVAPMPGMVVNVLVQEGQEVNSGDVLVVMESMKMQMQLRAPLPGKVSKVNAQSRAQVEKGSLLVKIAASPA
jgi:pyruvate carboxylase subunit B